MFILILDLLPGPRALLKALLLLHSGIFPGSTDIFKFDGFFVT